MLCTSLDVWIKSINSENIQQITLTEKLKTLTKVLTAFQSYTQL